MNPLEGLAQYMDRLERRLRMFAWTRGAAAVFAAALILTAAIVGSLMLSAFSPSGILIGRFILFLGIGGAVAVALVVPLMRLNRRRAAQEVEQRHPGFDQRLLTFTERSRDDASDPFLPLLAEDALVVARDAEPERVIAKSRFVRFASLAAGAATVLIYLVFVGPGFFGYGTQLLWGSYGHDGSNKPLYNISVQPGSKTIRRKSDQMISANLSGYTASHATLWVQWANSSKWEQTPMEPQTSGPGFAFLLVRVPDDLQYYVEAGGLKSETFKLHTIDLPSVKNIKVTYNYPSWTGLTSVTEDPGGDLRAVQGTVAKVEIQTDKPLSNAQVVFEDGKPIDLDSTTNDRTTTNIPIQKDGTYHIAVMDHGELVRLTDDYFIEARKPGEPAVHITRPARDAKVSPIEEVAVTVNGEDEYPLQEMDLHYSVNGMPEKVMSMLKQKGLKQAEGSTMLSMEDFKLVPGDIVSVYATAKDGRGSAKTDMYFIQAVPFEFEYTQSQAGGGGGGGGGMDQEQQISEREKEIIAATFNQLKGDSKIQAAAGENGKYLSETQAKLRDQAQSLANRTKARQLDGSGAAFQNFVKEMELAVASMSPASDKLKGLQFQDALTPEQQALQHLLRAENTFRQIQVQISRGGGGGGGGGGAGRDLANLFDLELDKDKNQYETSAASAAEQKQQQVDEALKKLEELARRQQQLAEQQQNNPQALAQQRYEQEMLRREAEELKRQMEQLQRDQSGQQSQQGQQGQQSARSQQNGMGGQQGSLSRAVKEQLDRAIKDLDQAERDMSNAASARQPGQQGQQANSQAQQDAERAAEGLRQAGQKLQQARKQQNGSEVGDLARQSEQLASQQQDYEQRLRRNFGQGQQKDNQQLENQMADEKQRMIDSYNNLQKQMQQAARDVQATQPGVSKDLRDAMGRIQQDEIGTRMEFTQEALRRGIPEYAIMREAPVTQALNELRDQLRKIEAESAAQGLQGDDKSQIAMQQALANAERIRQEMEALARRGQKPGNQQGSSQLSRDRQGANGQQQAQNGQQQGNQQGQGQQGGQQQAGNQPGQGQQGGQQQGGQQGQGQQPGQQAGLGPRGGNVNPYGGGQGVNTAPRSGNAGGYAGEPYGAWNYGGVDPRMGQLPPEQVYSDLMRDLSSLRGKIADDKDLSREYQDLIRRAQELNPGHSNNEPQLSSVIGAQALSEIDELELVLRKKLAAADGAVRSTSPRNIPPGYDAAVAEYTKRLSKQ